MRSTLLYCAALTLCLNTASTSAAEPSVNVRSLLTRALEGVDGKEATMIVVELPPGANSPPHRHNANTFVYVLEGEVVMQVRGGDAVTLRAGETFYESPADVHIVSRNPSAITPAKLLVVLIKPIGAPVTVPAS